MRRGTLIQPNEGDAYCFYKDLQFRHLFHTFTG